MEIQGTQNIDCSQWHVKTIFVLRGATPWRGGLQQVGVTKHTKGLGSRPAFCSVHTLKAWGLFLNQPCWYGMSTATHKQGGQCWGDIQWYIHAFQPTQHQCPKEKSFSKSSDWRRYVSWGGVWWCMSYSFSMLVFRISFSHFGWDDDDSPKNSFRQNAKQPAGALCQEGDVKCMEVPENSAVD